MFAGLRVIDARFAPGRATLKTVSGGEGGGAFGAFWKLALQMSGLPPFPPAPSHTRRDLL